ncbi:putative oxidoreductase [Streptomyces zinciresistens K42]|uniref:Putative oxidoreductase n=1 Tax=Streptomyces zinciresistens K42 TaxID=700597 RepID=G2GFZ8_9ACTN|nr:BBE domain-containing protein [Streptomyces zinciresistens]EGX57577.1 putative oxidoreductase [Streptomyces zinciresistens K42]
MSELNRRGLLTRAALTGAGLVTADVIAGGRPAAAATPRAGQCAPAFDSVTVQPADSRYESFVRAHNTRFSNRPDQVTVATSAAQVAEALGRAVAAGRQVAVRSGGHCLENFTTYAGVEELIDLSQMADVHYDERMRAFAVGPGAIVAPTQNTLFKGWGVTIPSAGCSEVGLGGHILGGGYNFYSRIHGVAVDHLHAVEVVVAGADGQPRTIVATRRRTDPHRDLWWAHTGGGGGNFGIVTRYWLRTPGVASTDPGDLLPRASNQLVRNVQWSWDNLSPRAFRTLVGNYSRWYERNSAPGAPEVQVWASFSASHQAAGVIGLMAGVSKDVPGGEALLNGLFDATTAGAGVTSVADTRYELAWLDRDNWYWGQSGRQKDKTSDLKKSYTDAQLDTIYGYLTDDSVSNPGAQVNLAGLGGKINSVRSDATAYVHRDSVLRVYFTPGVWRTEADDAAHVGWVRRLYRDVYRDTGGVPVPNAVNAGAYINYPDVDLADPAWNTSGTPWHGLYYGANYARLQRVKSAYDPRDLFRHALSIRPA